MKQPILYKYRSLDNWRLVADIIVHGRLYAAPFESLNDPMEGRYYFFGGPVRAGFKKALLQSKRSKFICSLSRARASTLLWSYYAGGHTGVAFGVRLRKNQHDLRVRDVRYDSGVHLGKADLRANPDQLALDILTQKQLAWEHEREVRVFAMKSFVAVELEELVLGCNVQKTDAALVTALARKWHPGIRVTQLKRGALDHPDAV